MHGDILIVMSDRHELVSQYDVWSPLGGFFDAMEDGDVDEFARSAREVAGIDSPFAGMFKERCQEYIALQFQSGTEYTNGMQPRFEEIGIPGHDQEKIRDLTLGLIREDIVRLGLRTYVYADFSDIYRHLKPGSNKHVFYRAAIIARPEDDELDRWIVEAIKPTDELLGLIERAEGSRLNMTESDFEVLKGLTVIKDLGLADEDVEESIDFIGEFMRLP